MNVKAREVYKIESEFGNLWIYIHTSKILVHLSILVMKSPGLEDRNLIYEEFKNVIFVSVHHTVLQYVLQC
jgi:hypothetical protein